MRGRQRSYFYADMMSDANARVRTEVWPLWIVKYVSQVYILYLSLNTLHRDSQTEQIVGVPKRDGLKPPRSKPAPKRRRD